jgi:hypothetical protein
MPAPGLLSLILACAVAGPATAHPHIFVDAAGIAGAIAMALASSLFRAGARQRRIGPGALRAAALPELGAGLVVVAVATPIMLRAF